MKKMNNIINLSVLFILMIVLSFSIFNNSKVFGEGGSNPIAEDKAFSYKESENQTEYEHKENHTKIEAAFKNSGYHYYDKHVNNYAIKVTYKVKEMKINIHIFDVTTYGLYQEQHAGLKVDVLDSTKTLEQTLWDVKGNATVSGFNKNEDISFIKSVKQYIKITFSCGSGQEQAYQFFELNNDLKNPTIGNAVPEKDGNEKINYVIIDDSIYTQKTPEIQFSDNYNVAKIIENDTAITTGLPKQTGNYKVDNPTNNTVYTLQAEDTYKLKSNTIKYVYRTENMANFYLLTNYGYTTQEGDVFYTNKPIKFDINNDKVALLGKIEVKHNNSSSYDIMINTEITEFNFPEGDGKYVFKYYDKLGFKHTRTITIYYDRENPVLKIFNSLDKEVTDGSFIHSGFYFKNTDNVSVSGYKVFKNGTDVTNSYVEGSQTVYFEKGTEIYYTDRAVLFDKLKSQEIYQTFSNFTATEENIAKVHESDISYIFEGNEYFEYNNKIFARISTLQAEIVKVVNSKIEISSKALFTVEGEYRIKVNDKAGNSVEKTFTLINTKLQMSLKVDEEAVDINSENYKGIYNNFIVNIEETFNNRYFKRITYQKQGDVEVTADGRYLDSQSLTDGCYTIKWEDKAGNITSFNIILDTKKPVLTNYNEYINSDTTCVFKDKYIDYVEYRKGAAQPIKLNGGSVIIKADSEGVYTIWAIDKAGNKSEESYVIVDTTKPVITNHREYTNESFDILYEDSYIKSVYLKNPAGDIAEENGDSINLPVTAQGKWTVYAVDKAGNKSNESHIIVDTIKPVIKIEDILKKTVGDGGVTNKPVKFDVTDINLSGNNINIYEKINGEYVLTVSDFNTGKIYFNALDLRELEGNELFNKYSIGDKEYYISGTTSSNESILLNNAFNNITFEEVIYNGEDFSFINDYQKTIAEVNEKIYRFRFKVFNIDKTRENGVLSYDEVDIYSTEKTPLKQEAEKYNKKNILSVSYNAFHIGENEDREFKVKAEDKAGNIVEKYFRLDNILPSVSIFDNNGINIDAQNGLIKSNKEYIEITAEENSIIYRNGEVTESYPLREDKQGLFIYIVKDRAGNEVVIKVIIDREAPVIQGYTYFDGSVYYTKNITSMSLVDGTGIKKVNYTFKAASETDILENSYDSILSVALLKNNPGNTVYEREITVVTEDEIGNRKEYIIIEDNVSPGITVNDGSQYIRELNRITLKDEGVYPSYIKSYKITLKKRVKGNELIDVNEIKTFSDDITLRELILENLNIYENGIYEIETADILHNRAVDTFVIFKNDEKYILNESNIKDGFKELKWISVTLPGYIFSEESGTYSFRDLESARDFVIDKEIKARVIKRDKDFMYISKANPTVAELYETEESLMEVVKFYAYQYIEGEKIYVNGNNNLYSIIDPKGLNNQNIEEFNEITTYRIKKGYKFIPNTNILKVPTVILFSYYNEGTGEFEEPFEIDPQKTVQMNLEGKKQGYYGVFEYDLANIKDVQNYIVFYDNNTPYLKAETTMGDNAKEEVTFDKEYIEENTSVSGSNILRYVGYKIRKIDDKEDRGMSVIVLNGGGFRNAVYLASDVEKIPEFSFESGYYGKITIRVYDRNYNSIEYTVRIAGEDPKWIHSDEEDTKSDLYMRFKIDDMNNSFKEISIYKYELEGSDINTQKRIKLEKDSYGFDISENRFRYDFKTGGKYQVEYTDIYGRKYVEEPIFYMKNLPYAKLSVKEKGITNKNVSVVSGMEDDIYLYKKIGDNYVLLQKSEYELIEENFKRQHVILSVDNVTEENYKVLLINKEDRGLYKEYSFAIDSVICEYFVETINGEVINTNTAINSPFKIKTGEIGAKVEVKKKGAFLFTYHKDSYITEDGEYEITVKDRVGNINTFIMILDRKVDFDIEGQYIKENEEYLTNSSLEIILKEKMKSMEGNIKKVEEGRYIVKTEGRNEITLEDMRGNILTLFIVIDLTPPKYTLNGVENGGKTNGAVSIDTEEDSTPEIFLNGLRLGKNIYEFKTDGEYKFNIKDKAGNTGFGSFVIDTKVDYSINIFADVFYTTNDITVKLREEGEIKVIKDGKEIANETLNENGKYEIVFRDLLGNEKKVTAIKIPNISKEYTFDFTDQEVLSIKKDNSLLPGNVNVFTETGTYQINLRDCSSLTEYRVNFNVDSIKPEMKMEKLEKGGIKIIPIGEKKSGLEYEITRNGKIIEYKGNSLKEPGKYHLVVRDKLGNVSEYDFVIKRQISKTGVILLSVFILSVLSIVIYLIYRRLKMKIS